MKTIYTYLKRVVLAGCMLAGAAAPTFAQWDSSKAHLIVDWQMNAPFSTGYADKISGWGMNFEGGYFLTSNFALGGFLAYHSNHEYFSRQTLPVGTSGSLNTDQQHTVFQLPFGLATRYAWNRGGAFQPYVGVKLGTQYAQLKSTFNVFETNKDTWGFYISPEIGFNVYPWAYGPGLHFAAYYSYGTNKGDLFTYSVDGMNNLGLRIGIAF